MADFWSNPAAQNAVRAIAATPGYHHKSNAQITAVMRQFGIEAIGLDAYNVSYLANVGGKHYDLGSNNWQEIHSKAKELTSQWDAQAKQEQAQAQKAAQDAASAQQRALEQQRAAQAEQQRLQEQARREAERLAREAEQRRIFGRNQADLERTNLRTGAASPEDGTGLAGRLLGGTALEEGRESASSIAQVGATTSGGTRRRRAGGLSSAVGINL